MSRCSGQRSLQVTFTIISGPSVDFTCSSLNYLIQFFYEYPEIVEKLYVDFNKPLFDVYDSSDQIYNQLNKGLVDFNYFTDEKSIFANKPLFDVYDSSDQIYNYVNKTRNDSSGISDLPQLTTSKSFFESSQILENTNLILYKYNTENPSTAMYGELFLHSYVEIDYFTGTYVGTLQQFS